MPPQSPYRTLDEAVAAAERRQSREQPTPLQAPQFDSIDKVLGEVDPLVATKRQSVDLTPERAQRILHLSTQTGLPPGLVETDFDKLDRLSQSGTIEPAHLREVSPAIATWLAQNRITQAATSAEELTRIRAVERQFHWADPLLRSIDHMQGGVFGWTEAIGEATGSEWMQAMGRSGRERNRLEAMAYGEGPRLATAFTGVDDFGHYVYNVVGEQVPVMGVTISSAYAGAAAGAAIGTVVPGIGNVVGGTIGGLIGAFVPSWVLGVGEVQQTIKELDPNAVAPTTALLAGSAIGALDTALPGKIGARLVRTLGRETAEKAARRLMLHPVKPKFLVTTARGTITGMRTEALTEGFQEAIGGLAGAYGADTPVDLGQLGQQILEASVAGAIAGGVFEGGIEAARFKREEARWVAAKQQQEYLKALGTGIVDSKLLQTLPEEGRKWITHAVKNGPIEQVYVPIDQWEEYWQTKGESPHVMADAVTGRADALQTAKASKTGLLPIRTEDFATRLISPEHGEFFYKEVKLRPDLANIREAQEASDRAARLIADARKQAEQARQSALDTIRGRLVEMWVERGTSRRQAGKWADLYAPRYIERARRLGQDPVKAFEADPRVVFYSLASGKPLIPTPPRKVAAEGQPVPEVSTDPIAALPDTVLSEAREETLDLAFRAITATPTDQQAGITLEEHGFTPEEVAALEAAGLATGGRMVRGQFADYLEIRGAQRTAAEGAAAPTVPELAESVAPEGETAAERARRTGVQVAALTSILTRQAQTLDPGVTGEVIRAALDQRFAYDAEQAEAVRQSGRGQALLRAIAELGGIWYGEQSGGEKGEVLFYARDSRDIKVRSERGGRTAEQYEQREWEALRDGQTVRGIVPTWNGIAGVFQRDGKTPDDMAFLLRQSGEFANIEGGNDLFNAIDLALRANPERDVLPGTADLGRLGIDPATMWWQDQWGVDPALVEDELAFERDAIEGEGDITFDPTEFEQRVKQGWLPHGATVTPSEFGRHRITLPGGGSIDVYDPKAYAVATPRDYLAIGYVYVPQEQRRQGTGRKLYEAAVGYALSQGYKGLASNPDERNDFSDAMWRALDRDGVVEQVGDFDVVTYTGGEFFQRRGEPRALPQEFWQRIVKPVPPTVDAVAGFTGMSRAVARHATPMTRIPLKKFMQARVLAALRAAGFKGPLKVHRPEVQEYLVRVLVKEGLDALQQHPEALGWYDLNVRQARAVMALIHPELGTDEDAWFVFTYMLAVLSNGTTVNENFKNAVGAYESFKKKGTVPTNLGRGIVAATANRQLRLFNKQVKEHGGVEGGGVRQFRQFLMKRFVTRELKRQGFKSVAALADEEVFGALILGPKIGNGFLLNLNGVYSQFTMDRWWSRMWGRLTGTLIIDKSKQVKKNRVRLRKGLAKLRAEERTLVESIVGSIEVDTDRDIDKVARAIFRAASTQALLPPLKVTPRVAEVRKAANTLVDNLLFERETPQHNTERAIMKQVGLRALVEIAKRSGYTKLAPADYQALLWYPEKRLYETAAKGVKVSGYDKDSAPNYANAARDYAREQTIADDAIRAALDREEAKNRERRPAAAAGRAGTLRPGVRGRFRPGARPQPGAVRRFAQRGGVEEVRSLEDTGEFYQAPASATLAGFYSRLTLPVRDAKVDKAKGRDWAAIIKAAKTGINLDEYRAVGVQALEEQGADETFTRDEVLAFLKANEIHLETVELANPDELIDPALLDRKKREYLHALVEDQMDLAREEDRAPRMWTEADLLVEEDPEGGWVVSVDGESIPDRWTTHDSEGDAEIAGREWIEEQNETTERNWRDEIANGLDWDAIDEEVRRTLREQYRDREAQYASWVLPGGRDGTYREVFVTAPDAGAGGLAEAQRRILDAAIARLQAQPDLTADGAFARDMLRRVRETGDYRVKRGDFVMLSGWENEVLRAAVPYPEGDGRGTVQGFVHEATLTNLPTNWEDGHPGYEHIVNPIVRLRFNVRSVRREDGHLDTVLFLEEVQPPARHEFSKMPEVFQNTWRELAMRFALQHAAINGYDRVAWTSGAMQLRRYPHVRGVVDQVFYSPTTHHLELFDADGTSLLERSGVHEHDLPRFLGEEETARLLATDPVPGLDGRGVRYIHTPAKQIVAGGDGLVTLYDEQLGHAANHLPAMRRSKVSTTTMVLPDMHERTVYRGATLTAADLTPEALTARGGALVRGWVHLEAADVTQRMVEGASFAEAIVGSPSLARFLGGRIEGVSESARVPGIHITPQLRETLRMRGQEFFQPGARRALANEPYQDTLFGDPMPQPDPMAPELPTRVAMVTTGSREIGTSWVHSAADAAAAMAYLARGAQERFDALVTDEDGTPLALLGGFKGTVDQAAVPPDVLLAEALNVPGAAHIVFAHNHPSGDPTLSDADRMVLANLARVFADSGIEVDGLLAIGAGLGAQPQYTFTRPNFDASMDESGEARAPTDPMTVPIREREVVAVDKLDARPITTPALALSVLPQIAQGRFGVVFLDNRLRATGFAPIDPATALALKEEGRARALYETWSQSGSNRVFVYAPDTASSRESFNVAQALRAIGVEVVDMVDPQGATGLPKFAYTGEFTMPEGGEFEGVRGSFNRLRGWIRLIAGAENLSTFLHESGHAFLHELMTDAMAVSLLDPAQQTDLQQGLVKDAHVVLRWFGFEGTIGDFLALSTDQQREMHEKWARAFEVYLYTGQAPSAELRSIFATFRAWLVTAYRYLLGNGRTVTQEDFERALSKEAGFEVKLAPEIKQVMDRLLASDEAIAAAREEGSIVPLYTDQASAGVDALTWAAYQQAIEAAHIKARETLDARLLAEWRREQGVEWQRAREQVREQVVNELNTNPVVVALSVIRTGKLPDGSIPSFGDGQPFKLSKAAIVRMKGEAFARRLPRPYLYTVTGGLQPDAVAELVGFTSGDAMLEALVDARSPKVTIEAETDRRMREQHGDAMLDGLELKEIAEQALHDARGEIISAELKALTQGMARAAVPSAAALNEAAERRISQMEVREVTPGLFLQAATRASQKAFDAFARNDRAAAVQFKIDELSTLALYRAAFKAKDRAQKTATLLGQFQTSPGRRKTLLRAGNDYLDQVDALLERYEFTKVTQRAIERRESLRKWIEKQQQDGLPVTIPDWLVDDTRRIHYTRLTIDELEGLRSAVDNIAHLARLKTKLIDARDQRELEAVRQEIAASILAHNTQRAETLEPRVGLAAVKNASAGILYSHRKLASIVRQLDGFEDGGAMWQSVMRRVNDAGNREAVMNGAATQALIDLFERFYRPGERANFNRKRKTPELDVAGRTPRSLSKQALLMMALNQGNETNRQRLRETYGWTQEQVQKALDVYLEKRDWEFVQAVWDYIETYWPQIVEKQTRVAGAVPEKVLATPVFTRHGEFRGGYFPIAYDGEQSGKQQSLELASAADLAKAAAYVHATTSRGHLERRVEGSVKRPIRLDFGVIHEHLGKVIHDLTHHEMLIDVGRIVAPDHVVGQAIVSTAGPRAYEQITRALRDIALGPAPARHEGEGLLAWLARGSTVVGLGWNAMSASLQWIGYTQTVQRIGWRWAAHGLGSFLRGALPMQQGVKAVYAESEMMRARYQQHSQELHDVREQLGIYSGRLSGWIDAGLRTVTADYVTKRAIADSYLVLISKAQQMVDVPTYLGAKAKAMADPKNLTEDGTVDEATCIALAEQAVLDSQGGGQIKDLAAIQRGSGAWKIWINFFSFFNVTYQLWAESVRRTGGTLRVNPANPIAVGRLAVDFLLLFTLPTLLVHLVRGVARGTLADELEDEPEALAWTLAKEQLSYMLGMFVVIREFAPLLERAGQYEGPAGVRGIGTIGKAISELQRVEWSEATGERGVLRALNATGGALFHYPAAQVEKTVRGFEALMSGETENPAVLLFGPPPKRR